MSVYLAEEELADSVRRLQDSRADSSLADFLILKRAMAINGTTRVELSTQDAAFTQAVSEFVQVPDGPDGATVWFNPFGTAREVPLGYRTAKYPSNGTAVTVGHWSEIVDVVGRERARIVEFKEGYESKLANRLLVRGDRPLPRLADAASWFNRATDLENILHDPTDEGELSDKFVEAVGLNEAEIAVLFDRAAAPHDEPATANGA
jgi:hypothetical protein